MMEGPKWSFSNIRQRDFYLAWLWHMDAFSRKWGVRKGNWSLERKVVYLRDKYPDKWIVFKTRRKLIGKSYE